MVANTLVMVHRVPHRPSSQPVAVSRERSIKVWVDSFSAGRVTLEPAACVVVHMYMGRSVDVRCARGDMSHYGRAVAGDLEIIPAHTDSAWEFSRSGTRLLMQVPESLLRNAAGNLGLSPGSIGIADRFQFRDPVIEHIAWTLKADIEERAGRSPIQDCLGSALATRLLQRHNSRSLPMRDLQGGMSAGKLKQIISYIDESLTSKLSLAKIAAAAGMSASHLQALFRNATGLSIHQYVLRRRVEHARLLLRNGDLAVSQVALASGFAHQSHLARHMRRIVGISPKDVRKTNNP